MAAVRISCAHCGQAYEVEQGQTQVRCPACGKTPAEAAAASAMTPAAQPPSRPSGPDPSAAPPPPPPPLVSSGHEPPPVTDRGHVPPPPPASRPQRDASAQGGSQMGQAATQVLTYGRELSLTWWGRVRKSLAKHARDIELTTAEQDALAANGVHDAAVQRHFVWRRSLLWLVIVPATFSALIGTIGQLAEGFEWATWFGVLMMLVYIASLWAIPASALLAAARWDRPRRSRQLLLAGFIISYGAILLWGFLPIHWMIRIEESDPDLVAAGQQLVQVIGALVMFFLILPAIMSLLPGAIRACVRIKVLFPESIVSGWLLITLTPVYALLLLTLFILINQMSGNFLLILGTALIVAAPAAYLANTAQFIRPLHDEPGRARIERAQWMYQIILAAGFALLILYALTGKLVGFPIVQFGRENGMIGFWAFAWHVIRFSIDYLGRSLFITALAMDWFLLINVSVWRQTRQFEKTEAAGRYEGTIEELGAVLGRD